MSIPTLKELEALKYSELDIKAAFVAGMKYEKGEEWLKSNKINMAGHLNSNGYPDFTEFIYNLEQKSNSTKNVHGNNVRKTYRDGSR